MATNAPTPPRETSMGLREHERTFRGFVRIMVWTAIVSLVILALVALGNG